LEMWDSGQLISLTLMVERSLGLLNITQLFTVQKDSILQMLRDTGKKEALLLTTTMLKKPTPEVLSTSLKRNVMYSYLLLLKSQFTNSMLINSIVKLFLKEQMDLLPLLEKKFF